MVLETLDGRSLETIFTSIQQRFEAAFGSSTGINVHTTQEHGGDRTAHLDFPVEELEDVSIRFLSAHSKATNWKQIVSLQNDFGQTMAHIAVMLGYPRLLGSLIGWGIDLNLTDLNGSTALHYAFLCNESACAVLLIRSGADELALDELGRSAWDLNPSLADECTSRLRGVPKADGSFSVSCHPAEESEMERAEEAGALEATYLLVQRWLERMEGDRSDTSDLNGEHMPQFVISPRCSPSNFGDRNGKKLSTLTNFPLIERLLLFTCSDLTVEKTRIDATRPNQSAGMVPKVHLLSDNLHIDSQSINSLPPHYSEWDGNKLAQSLRPTLNAINPFVVQDPQLQDVDGPTALHCACRCGDSDSVQVLKGYGADEDIKDTLGRRPLDMYKTGKTNMHPNLQALTQLPPPSERTIHGDIPIYYLQVPAHSAAKIRGPDATEPPMYVELLLVVYSAYSVTCNSWGAGEGEPDADGFRTWKLPFENGQVIYIRSQPVPKTGPGATAALLSTIPY